MSSESAMAAYVDEMKKVAQEVHLFYTCKEANSHKLIRGFPNSLLLFSCFFLAATREGFGALCQIDKKIA